MSDDPNILPCTRHTEKTVYLAVYSISTGKTISRPLRDKDRKYDISQFTRDAISLRTLYKYNKQGSRRNSSRSKHFSRGRHRQYQQRLLALKVVTSVRSISSNGDNTIASVPDVLRPVDT